MSQLQVTGKEVWVRHLSKWTGKFGERGEAVTLTATGGTEYDIDVDGTQYRVHEFTESGDFEVSSEIEAEYLVVAGGGGAGQDGQRGGGGGGGGIVVGTLICGAGAYPAIVGAGVPASTKGNDSSFAGITGLGGGAGARNLDTQEGGSGGGGHAQTGGQPGGTGIQPTSEWGGYGHNGGDGSSSAGTSSRYGGGGGGAGGAGANGTTSIGGSGGPGLVVWGKTYSAGGTADNDDNNCPPNSGNGSNSPTGYGTTITWNSGSGVVIIRYRIG